MRHIFLHNHEKIKKKLYTNGLLYELVIRRKINAVTKLFLAYKQKTNKKKILQIDNKLSHELNKIYIF